MLKYPFTILLMFIIGLQTFSRWLVFLDFEINKNYITAHFCVNRESPKSCCKGKCFLKKQLARDDDQQQPLNNVRKDVVPFFSEEPVLWDFSMLIPFEKITHPFLCGKSQDYFIPVFQPPQVRIFKSRFPQFMANPKT